MNRKSRLARSVNREWAGTAREQRTKFHIDFWILTLRVGKRVPPGKFAFHM